MYIVKIKKRTQLNKKNKKTEVKIFSPFQESDRPTDTESTARKAA